MADRYALDRFKLIRVRKVWENVSVDYGCCHFILCRNIYTTARIELKNKCVAFFADEKNFKKVVLTDDFIQPVQKFP